MQNCYHNSLKMTVICESQAKLMTEHNKKLRFLIQFNTKVISTHIYIYIYI